MFFLLSFWLLFLLYLFYFFHFFQLLNLLKFLFFLFFNFAFKLMSNFLLRFLNIFFINIIFPFCRILNSIHNLCIFCFTFELFQFIYRNFFILNINFWLVNLIQNGLRLFTHGTFLNIIHYNIWFWVIIIYIKWFINYIFLILFNLMCKLFIIKIFTVILLRNSGNILSVHINWHWTISIIQLLLLL